MHRTIEEHVLAVANIKAIPTMLEIVCRTTGMGFAAVVRVTEDRWVACSVRDEIAFGLATGGELKVETMLCHEIRRCGEPIFIDHVAEDPVYATHPTSRIYGLQSYISVPIHLTDGAFFGTLCAIDPGPRRVSTPEIVRMFTMFADVIGFHLSAIDRMTLAEEHLRVEKEAAALREEFIAVLGHDLRNPLSAIRSGTELLARKPEKAATIIPLVRGSVKRMSDLIDNVMDFARGRLGGGISVERSADEPLEEVLRQVVAEVQSGAPDRRFQIHIDLREPVHCDRRRLGQLLSNLVANAVTYGTADQPIRVNATTTDGWLEIFVTNAGNPIPPAAMERIFQPFARGEVRPSMQGLGLGLYIAHSIAKAHGGTLQAVSTKDETRFTFRMPLANCS